MHLPGVRQSTLEEAALKLPKLRHRKAMAAGKGCAVGLVIDERWLQRIGSIREVCKTELRTWVPPDG